MTRHGRLIVYLGALAIVSISVSVASWMHSRKVIAVRMTAVTAGAGVIRSAARTYLATHGGTFAATPTTLADLGFKPHDLDAKLVTQADYKFVPVPNTSKFTITYTPSAAAAKLGMHEYVLTEAGVESDRWREGD